MIYKFKTIILGTLYKYCLALHSSQDITASVDVFHFGFFFVVCVLFWECVSLQFLFSHHLRFFP